MSTLCAQVDAVVDERVLDGAWPEALAHHVASCAECRARVALARRIEHTLAAWPTATPPVDFAARVSAAVRRETWAQEVVVDWSFNLAVAGCVAMILAGVVATLWMVSAAAPVADSTRVAGDVLATVLARARGQAAVAAAAVALLATAVGGWWWAEQQTS